MTPVSNRPVPDGYTKEWDNTTLNAGFLFYWSNIYGGWVDCERTFTVKPGQSLCEAWEDRMDCPMWLDYTLFFGVG